MKIWHVMVLFLVASVFMNVTQLFRRNKNVDENKVIVPDEIGWWLGTGMGSLYLILISVFLVVSICGADLGWCWLIPIIAFIPCNYLLLFSLTFKIEMNEKGFTYQSVLRKKYYFCYLEVKEVKEAEGGLHIYCPKKKIDISYIGLTDSSGLLKKIKKGNPNVSIKHSWDTDPKMQKFLRENKLHEKPKQDIFDRVYEWLRTH